MKPKPNTPAWIIPEASAAQWRQLERLLIEVAPPILEQPKHYLREHTELKRAITKAYIEGRNVAIEAYIGNIRELLGGKDV